MPADDEITLDGTPPISGLVFRPFRDASDLPGLVAIHRGREMHDQVDPCSDDQRTPTVQELSDIYLNRDDFDPRVQMLIAEVGALPVGYTWIRVWAQDERTWVCAHRSHLLPDWRGKGIGTAMLSWAEDLLAAIAANRPTGVDAFYRSATYDTERETVARLESAGYALGNSTDDMALDDLSGLPEPPDLPGFVIRAPRPNEYQQVYFANEAAFADEWGHVERTDSDFEAFMAQPGRDPTLSCVAWDGNDIAGVVMAELARCGSRIESLSVGQR